MNGYCATVSMTVEELKAEDQCKKRNLWWKTLFPKTAALNNCRNPLKTTLGMLVEKKYREATESLQRTLATDYANLRPETLTEVEP